MSIIPRLKEMPVVIVEQIVRFRAEVFKHIALLELEKEKLEEERVNGSVAESGLRQQS